MIPRRLLPVLSAALLPIIRGDCIDLAPYAGNPGDLEILKGGGRLPDNSPVYFNIPSEFVVSEVVYCLESITIPSSVGFNQCRDAQSCWLAVGLHAGTDNDNSATENCVDSAGDTNGCYDCFCTGSTMNDGSSQQTSSNSCGLNTDLRWGMTCRDVTNGRYKYDFADGGLVASNSSAVHVSICPESNSDCGVCNGGLRPSFQIGVQWISNLEEQCFNNPFGYYTCSVGLQLSSVIGIAVGSALLLGTLITLYVVYFRKKKAVAAPAPATKRTNDPASPLSEELSFDTEASDK